VNTETVLTLATQLRAAIEATSFSMPPMDRFPKGCCGDATIFLSEYLMEYGFKTTYYCGVHPFEEKERNPQSHAWVVLDGGLIADITGDQFKENEEFLNYDIPVYVGVMDDFHRLFSSKQVEHIGGIDCYDPHSRGILRAQYNRIKENL